MIFISNYTVEFLFAGLCLSYSYIAMNNNFMFLNSSRNRYNFCSLFENMFPSIFRYLGTRSVTNAFSQGKIKIMFRYLGTRSVTNAIAHGYRRIDDPVLTRALTVALQCEKLLLCLVELKEYPKDMARSLSVYIDNLKISPEDTTLNYAFNCYRLSNRLRVDFGLSILARLFKKDCVPKELISSILTSDDDMMGIFKENRRTSETKELFEKIVRRRSCDIDVVTYGTLIDGLCKDGHSMIAVEVLRNMEQRDSQLDTRILSMVIEGWNKESGIYSKLEIFYKMLGEDMGLCEERNVYSALKSFYEIVSLEMKRGGSVYNDLICGLCDMRLDRKIYPDVKRGFEVLSLEWLLQDMIETYCWQGQPGKARKVFHFMDRNSIAPNNNCYCILIEGCCRKKKDVVHVMNLYREMCGKGLAPDVFTYNLILKQLFLTGRCSDALQIFEELQVVGLKPNYDMYCCMLLGMCQNRQVGQAVSLLNALELEGAPLHVEYYNIVIKGCREDGQFERAKDLLLKMEQVKFVRGEL